MRKRKSNIDRVLHLILLLIITIIYSYVVSSIFHYFDVNLGTLFAVFVMLYILGTIIAVLFKYKLLP